VLLTEDEAKTKRCQESFGDTNVTPTGHMMNVPVFASPSAGAAGVALTTSPSMCIGSACMAWRHWGIRTNNGDLRETVPHVRPSSFEEQIGYCGKAGRP
jgi:hypothetical protein